MEHNKAKLIRQSIFRNDGTTTDIPARNEEQPQLEKQETLFTYQDTEERKRRWEGEDNDKTPE